MKEGHFFEQKGLDASFYRRGVVDVAQDLLGKVLFVRNGGIFCAGRIVETEAYGENDRASHAYGGRRTLRNESMFLAGGHAYVYLCYGLHIMLNVVCEEAGRGAAVLLRALEPCIGESQMYGRRGKGNQAQGFDFGTGSSFASDGNYDENEWLFFAYAQCIYCRAFARGIFCCRREKGFFGTHRDCLCGKGCG